jgi:hypothetical protein
MPSEAQVVQYAMEFPKSSVGVFELPCGYLDGEGKLHTEAEVREITGEEEDMLASKAVPGAKKMSELLSKCVVRIGSIVDPGTLYEVLQDLVQGDRVFLMFAIRRVTLGDDYPFMQKCPNSECGEEQLFKMNLGELELKKPIDPKKRIFDIKLPTGLSARVHPAIGRDEPRIQKLAKGLDGPSQAIMLRLDMLDGKPPSLAAVKALGMKDRAVLREAFEDIEGGVNTTMDVECPLCGSSFQREVDIGDEGFFSPSAVLKSWKTKSSG